MNKLQNLLNILSWINRTLAGEKSLDIIIGYNIILQYYYCDIVCFSPAFSDNSQTNNLVIHPGGHKILEECIAESLKWITEQSIVELKSKLDKIDE